MSSKRNVFLWVLYDFANSFTQIVFLLYFAQWVVIEQGVADIYFNLVFVASAALLLLTAPAAGAWLDAKLRRITGLRYSTVAMALLYAATAIAAIADLPTIALCLYVFGFYFFLLTFTFYTPLIFDLASPEKRGRVSGYGVAANFAGQIVALIAVLPLSTGAVSFFGSSPRAETLLPAVAGFLLFALPMLIWFRESSKETIVPFSLANLRQQTKALFLAPGIALFLLAYFLANDAVLTVSVNFSIFLEAVWGVSDTIKTFLLLGILLATAVGGLFSGVLADRFGHKRSLAYVLSGWLILLPLMAITTDFSLYVALVVLTGLWLGAHWAVSRSVMTYLAPVGQRNLAFAYFGIMERASSFIGPLAWGLTVSGLVHLGPDRYRLAVALMAVFIALGLFTLTRVRSDRGIN